MFLKRATWSASSALMIGVESGGAKFSTNNRSIIIKQISDWPSIECDHMQFIAHKNGVFGGLLSSIEIGVDKDHILSSKLESNNCMWANKLMMLDTQIEVKKGDKICVTATTDPTEHVLKYDFSVAA